VFAVHDGVGIYAIGDGGGVPYPLSLQSIERVTNQWFARNVVNNECAFVYKTVELPVESYIKLGGIGLHFYML